MKEVNLPKYYTNALKLDKEFKELDSKHLNSLLCVSLQNHTSSVVNVGETFPPVYTLRRFELTADTFVVALIYEPVDEIVYYVKVQQWEDISFKSKPVTQVLVWRTTNIDHEIIVFGLPEKVFMNYLLLNYNIVISDTNQTIQGAYFWIRMISKLFQTGVNIYQYDLITGIYFRIDDIVKLRNNEYDTWGDSDEYQHRLLVLKRD
jgi:hypothetical protein